MIELTAEQTAEAEAAADEYFKKKKKKPNPAVHGFIVANYLVGLEVKEIDAIVANAEKVRNSIDPKTNEVIPGVIKGEGDKFKEWCERRGRGVPTDKMVQEMNAHPSDAESMVKAHIPTDVRLWRSYCTYRAGSK